MAEELTVLAATTKPVTALTIVTMVQAVQSPNAAHLQETNLETTTLALLLEKRRGLVPAGT